MKRVTILIFVLVVSTTNTSCCRGLRCWGLRGAPCSTPYAAPYTAAPAAAAPVYTCPPVACPPVNCPPVECVPSTVCPPDPCYSYDYGSGTTIQPVPAPTQSAPSTLDGVYLPGDATTGMVYYTRPVTDQIVSPLQPIPSLSPAR